MYHPELVYQSGTLFYSIFFLWSFHPPSQWQGPIARQCSHSHIHHSSSSPFMYCFPSRLRVYGCGHVRGVGMHSYVVESSHDLRQRFCVVVVDNVVGGGLEVTRGIVFIGWFFLSGSKISFQVINSYTRQLRKLVRTIHYFFL